MKMVIAVVNDHDAHDLMNGLNKAGLKATRMASTGGFLREGNTTFIIGTKADQVEEVIAIIRESCKSRKKTVAPMSPVANSMEGYYSFPMEVQVGGATVFVLDVEQFLKL